MNEEPYLQSPFMSTALLIPYVSDGLRVGLNVNPEGLVMRLNGEMRGLPCNIIHERDYPQTRASTSAQGPMGLLTVTDSPEQSNYCRPWETLALEARDTSGWLDQNSVLAPGTVLFHPCSYLVL